MKKFIFPIKGGRERDCEENGTQEYNAIFKMINIVLWMPQTNDEVVIEFYFELKHIPNELLLY